MTLRVTFTIVPYGEESSKYDIHELNIHNKRDYGLGYCEYYGTLKSINYDKKITTVEFKEIMHSRQDGALELVKKVIDQIDKNASSNP